MSRALGALEARLTEGPKRDSVLAMNARNGTLGWAIAHALARLGGASFGFAATWLIASMWGGTHSAGLTLLQLGMMVVSGLIYGALLGLLPGQVLLQWLPEADFETFVRNTLLLVGAERLLTVIPLTLAVLNGGISPELVSFSHTLAGLGFALLIGALQARALRSYPRTGRYILASVLGQLAGLLLEWLSQTLLPSFTLSLPAIALRLGWAFVYGALVALPTAWALKRIRLGAAS